MRELILRLNENGSKQYDSSRFPYMEVVSNMDVMSEISKNRNCVGVTSTI